MKSVLLGMGFSVLLPYSLSSLCGCSAPVQQQGGISKVGNQESSVGTKVSGASEVTETGVPLSGSESGEPSEKTRDAELTVHLLVGESTNPGDSAAPARASGGIFSPSRFGIRIVNFLSPRKDNSSNKSPSNSENDASSASSQLDLPALDRKIYSYIQSKWGGCTMPNGTDVQRLKLTVGGDEVLPYYTEANFESWDKGIKSIFGKKYDSKAGVAAEGSAQDKAEGFSHQFKVWRKQAGSNELIDAGTYSNSDELKVFVGPFFVLIPENKPQLRIAALRNELNSLPSSETSDGYKKAGFQKDLTTLEEAGSAR